MGDNNIHTFPFFRKDGSRSAKWIIINLMNQALGRHCFIAIVRPPTELSVLPVELFTAIHRNTTAFAWRMEF